MEEQIPVLMIRRDPPVSDGLKYDLDKLGFKYTEKSYSDVDKSTYKRTVEAILLELIVYDYSALSICELLRDKNIIPPEIPLIAILSEDTMRQISLDYNFTDIVRYPYKLEEFNYRLRRAIYCYRKKFTSDKIVFGNLSLSPSRYEVKVDGQPIFLSHKEYELLKYLVTHPDTVITREKLLDTIWDDNPGNGSRTVDVHIRRIRAKIGDIDQTFIKTIRSVGYAFRYNE